MLWTICEGRCAGDGVGSSSGGYTTYDVGEVGDGTEHVLECGVDLCIQIGRGRSKMGWEFGRAEMVGGVGAEVDGEELCGRGWSTAFGDSGGLHVGGQIVGNLVVLRDRAPKIDRAGGILRIDVVSSGWRGDHNAERA